MRTDPSRRLTSELRHRVAQQIVHRGALVARKRLLEARQPAADRFERGPHRLCRDDARYADFGRRLLPREQDLVQALAGTGAGEFDADVAAGLEPAQTDDALGQIDD